MPFKVHFAASLAVVMVVLLSLSAPAGITIRVQDLLAQPGEQPQVAVYVSSSKNGSPQWLSSLAFDIPIDTSRFSFVSGTGVDPGVLTGAVSVTWQAASSSIRVSAATDLDTLNPGFNPSSTAEVPAFQLVLLAGATPGLSPPPAMSVQNAQAFIGGLDVSSGITTTAGSSRVYTAPGAIVFSPASGGTYSVAQDVTLACDNAAALYYTTNGNVPTTGSTLYNGAFSLDGTDGETKTVRALATGYGPEQSTGSATYTFDKTVPHVVQITAPPGTGGWVKAGDTVPFIVEFSEAVYLRQGSLEAVFQTDAGDRVATVTASNGLLSVSGSYTVQPGDACAAQALNIRTVGVSVGGSLTDAAGNAMAVADFAIPTGYAFADAATVHVDTVSPASVVSTSGVHGPLTPLAQVTGTAADTGGSGLHHMEITLQRTIDSYYWTGGGWLETPQWLPVTGTATWSLSLVDFPFVDGRSYVVHARAVDVAGNVESVPSSNAFSWDASPPTVAIGAPLPAVTTKNGVVSYPITITGAQTVNLTAQAVTVERVSGAATWTWVGVENGTSTTPTVQVLAGDGTGELRIRLAAGCATDTAGNVSAETPFSQAFAVDTTVPEATLTTAILSPTNLDLLTFALSFTKAVTATPAAAAFTLSNGTIAEVTPTSDRTFTVTVTPSADGAVTVALNADAVTDAAGNGNTASGTVSLVSDRTAPGNPSPRQPNPPLNTPTTNNIVTFAGWLNSGSEADANGVAGWAWVADTQATTQPGTTLAALPTQIGFDGRENEVVNGYLHVRTLDNAGNWSGTSHIGPWIIDWQSPAVTVNQAAGQPDPTGVLPIHFTAAFSESVTGFAAADVTLGGTAGLDNVTVTIQALAGTGGNSYDIAVDGVTGSGTVTASISAGRANDLAGNANGAATSSDNSVTLDRTLPAAIVAQAPTQPDPTHAQPVHFTVTFTKPINGLTAADFVLGGTAGHQDALVTLTETAPEDRTHYAIELSGLTGNGTVTLDLPADTVQDDAGNANLAATAQDNQVTLDTVAPTVTASLAAGQPTPANTLPVWFRVQFSEPVTAFDTADCILGGTANASSATIQITAAAPQDGSAYDLQIGGLSGDGTLTLALRAAAASDAAGNPSEASAASAAVTYDTQPPAALLSGLPASPTNLTTASATVAGADVVAYRYQLDGGAFGAETPVAQPISLAGLAGGAGTQHTLRVIGRDSAGNWQAEGQATSTSWTVDTQAPAAVVTGVPTNPTSQTSATLAVSGTDVVAYRWAVDGGSYGGENPVATPVQLADLTGGAGTTHTVRVIGRDTAGNWQTTAEATVVNWLVDTEPPVAVLSGAPASPTAQTSAVITVSGADVVAYRCAVDGGAYGPETAVGTAISLNDLTGGAAAPHLVTVLGRDTAGNWQSTTSPTTASWVIDTQAPAKPATPQLLGASDTGWYAYDTITADNQPSIGGTAEAGAAVRVYVDGLLAGTTVAAVSGGGYTFTLATALADGPHQLQVVAADAAGNDSAASDPLGVTIDTTAPTVQLSGLPASVSPQTSVQVTVSGPNVVVYSYAFDDIDFATAGLWLIDEPIVLDYLSDGAHTLRVIGFDLAGNWQPVELATTYTWTVDTTAPVPPTVPVVAAAADTGVSASDGITADNTPTVNTTAEAGATVRFYVNDQPTAPSQVPPDGQLSLDVGPLTDGTYTITAEATDAVGNTSALSGALTLVIDTQTPPATAGGLPQDPTGAQTAQISVGGDGVSHYRYRLDNGTLSNLTDVATAITLAALSASQHTLTIVGYDLAGNHLAEEDAFHYSWTVDTNVPINPELTASVPEVGHSTRDHMVTGVTWTTGQGVVHSGYTWALDKVSSTQLPEAAEPATTLPTELTLTSGDGQYWLHLRTKGVNGLWSGTGHYGPWAQDIAPPVALVLDPPVTPTRNYSFQMQVGGAQVTLYRWRLAGETDWSAETPVATLLQVGQEEPLADGSHLLEVRGADEAGNWQTELAATPYSWLVDTVPPEAPLLSATPPTGVTVFTNQLSASLDWQPAADAGSGIRGYVWLVDRQSNSVPPIRTPESQLPSSVSFTLGGGDYYLHVRTFDLAGNNRVDHYGPWRVDTQAPTAPVLLSATPAVGAVVRLPTVSLQWQSAVDAGSAGVDGYAWAVNPLSAYDPATGNPSLAGLPAAISLDAGDGSYWLHVRCRDKAGNWGAILTSGPWTLDTAAPTADVTGVPVSPTNLTSVVLVVGGQGVTGYRFSLDGGAYGPETPVSGGLQLNGLTGGAGTPHTVHVIGRDTAGNWQSETNATAVTWTIDTEPPVAILTGVPADPTNQVTAAITVGGSGAVGYRYALDGGSYGAETPVGTELQLSGLAGGAGTQHVLHVVVRDTAGNWQATGVATTATWLVDTEPPVAVLTGVPNSPTAQVNATITVGGSGVIVYRFALDGGAYGSETAVAVPINLTALAGGAAVQHSVDVIGRDAAGNWQSVAQSTVAAWTVDTEPPAAPVVTNAGESPTYSQRPGWLWDAPGYPAGPFRFKLDDANLEAGATLTTATAYEPSLAAYPDGLPPGDHTLYVQVQDAAGNWSPTGSGTCTILWQVTVVLQPGWNIVAFPGTPFPVDTANLLAQAQAAYAWGWEQNVWKTVQQLQPFAGYWLRLSGSAAPVSVLMRGTAAPVPPLKVGWNLAGVPRSTPASALPATILSPVWKWGPAAGLAPLTGAAEEAPLAPGTGYWFYATEADVSLDVPQP